MCKEARCTDLTGASLFCELDCTPKVFTRVELSNHEEYG
jgi:hypothetical protein